MPGPYKILQSVVEPTRTGSISHMFPFRPKWMVEERPLDGAIIYRDGVGYQVISVDDENHSVIVRPEHRIRAFRISWTLFSDLAFDDSMGSEAVQQVLRSASGSGIPIIVEDGDRAWKVEVTDAGGVRYHPIDPTPKT